MPYRYPLQYAKQGLYVFPIVPGKSKPPLISGWQEQSTTDQQRIAQWAEQFPGCNWGVYCEKSGLCVIDVDNKHGKPGNDSFLNLELEHDLNPTLVVKTPNNGFHHYYKGLAASTSNKLGLGIDTKSIGGYVVLPGSIRSNGKYEVIKSCNEIPQLPESLKKQIGQPRAKDPDHDTPVTELDQPHNIARATDYLINTAKPSIEGSGGDDNAYKVACRVRDLGISEDTALDLMYRFWNSRCEPPWSYEELTAKTYNAFRYSQNKAGIATAEADFDPIEQHVQGNAQFEPILNDNNFPKPKKISNYLSKPIDRSWLIKDWIPEGEISALYGDGGIGKSLISLQLAVSVASGAPFLGLEISKKTPVLAVMAEDKDDELHRRIYSISTSPEYEFSEIGETELYLWSVAGHSSVLAEVDQGTAKKKAFYDRLDKQLSELPNGSKLLILDTLSDVFAGNENDRQSASRFIKVVLHSLINKHDLTILLLAHPSLTGQNTGSFLSGSTAWNNSVRNRLVIRPHEDATLRDRYRILECVKSNYAKAGDYLTIFWENGTYKSIESNDDVFDEIDQMNMELVYDSIVAWAKLERPIGMNTNSSNFIGTVPIRTYNDRPMPLELKKRYVSKLVMEKRIVSITGLRAGKNGLHPKIEQTEKRSEEQQV